MKNSFKSLIRRDYLSASINGQQIANMFPEELKMIMDEYSFIFNNYVDARNKILNNEVEFDFDFKCVYWTTEQKQMDNSLISKKIPTESLRITSNVSKVKSLGITSLMCKDCLESKELSNFTILNGCYAANCKTCRNINQRKAHKKWYDKNKGNRSEYYKEYRNRKK